VADLAEGGSEQSSLPPMIEAARPMGTAQTLITGDAGYHSKDNVEALRASQTPVRRATTRLRTAASARPGRRSTAVAAR
jgi:hypothetical protein